MLKYLQISRHQCFRGKKEGEKIKRKKEEEEKKERRKKERNEGRQAKQESKQKQRGWGDSSVALCMLVSMNGLGFNP